MKNRIKEFRTQQKLTMQALADKVGTTASQINKLEKGERRLTADWMYRIATALDIAPVDIFPKTDIDKETASTQTQPSPLPSTLPAAPILNLEYITPPTDHESQSPTWHFHQGMFDSLKNDVTPALIQINQDDLEPDVMRGDYVLINTNDQTPSPAGLFVLHTEEGECTLQHCKTITTQDGKKRIQVIYIEKQNQTDGALIKKKALHKAEDINILGRIIAHWHWLS